MPKKLVRDLIPEIIEKNDNKKLQIDKDYSKSSPEDFPFFLSEKLVEEAEEYRKAIENFGLHSDNEFTKKIRVEELADVYEVLCGLAALDGLTMKDVEAVAETKRAERGGFDQRFILVLPWKEHDRDPHDDAVFHERCSVGFDADIQVTTDGRKRGLWVWVRAIDLKDKDRETAVLLEWPAIEKLYTAIKKNKKKKG
jgi:predicted house-cleaning noncanonical NTP pyrophosphatase (MazG superfamily)